LTVSKKQKKKRKKRALKMVTCEAPLPRERREGKTAGVSVGSFAVVMEITKET